MRTKARGGFTLVELLVVIAIIGILSALMMSAVQKVRERGREVQCRAELSQLETSLANFKKEFGIYPPCSGSGPNGTFQLSSTYNLTAKPETALEFSLLKQFFPRLEPGVDNGLRILDAGTGEPTISTSGNFTSHGVAYGTPLMLDPNQCMIFFLSGGAFTGYSGFSTNPLTPFQAQNSTSGSSSTRLRGGAFYNFPGNRLMLRKNFKEDYFTNGNSSLLRFTGDAVPQVSPSNQNVFPREQSWFVDPWGTPYLYLSTTRGNDYPFTPNATPGAAPTPRYLTIGPWGGAYSPNGTGVVACFAPQLGNAPNNVPKFINKDSCQVFSAGRDKKVGPGCSAALPGGFFAPATGVYGGNGHGADDFANFQMLKLGVQE